MSSAVERAVHCIWQRYGEPLSLADMASSAILSRFHFSRLFKEATGVSPGRFLSAVRIYHAKRMLLTTEMNVTDISFAVGYNSLGSFTNHFTDSVGIAPGRFRRLACDGGFRPRELNHPAGEPTGRVTGVITLPREFGWGRGYVGAFSGPIIQRRPAASAVVEVRGAGIPCPFQLDNVPPGQWHIQAVAVADSMDPGPWACRTPLVGTAGEVTVSAGSAVHVLVGLRSRQPLELPVLLALPDLENEPDPLTPAAVTVPTPLPAPAAAVSTPRPAPAAAAAAPDRPGGPADRLPVASHARIPSRSRGSRTFRS